MYYNDYALQKRAEAQQLTKLAYAARGILRMRNAQRAALQKQAATAGLLPYTLGGAGVGALLGGGSALLGNRDKDTAKRALIRALIGGVVGGGAGVGASFLHGALRGGGKGQTKGQTSLIPEDGSEIIPAEQYSPEEAPFASAMNRKQVDRFYRQQKGNPKSSQFTEVRESPNGPVLYNSLTGDPINT